jgi:hypothetical protein
MCLLTRSVRKERRLVDCGCVFGAVEDGEDEESEWGRSKEASMGGRASSRT